jgi:2-polyprenyl-3-methyl-5-hydroxy-6-metoxy-1,4-benzoquinol methylase
MPQSDATDYNRTTYNHIWGQLSDFIRYNPGARHRRRHVFKLLETTTFQSLLDVGCGNAELLRLLEERFLHKQYCGLDLSDTVVAANAEHLPHMRFATGNIDDADVQLSTFGHPDGFDVVLCTEVLEHLNHPEAALSRLGRACKPGGTVIVTCPTGHVFPTEKHFGHVRHPTPTDMRTWAHNAGLVVEELWSWGFPWYALTKIATNLNADAALKRFAGDKPYGFTEKAISTALYVANFANLRSSRGGVQLFVRLRRPKRIP